MSKRRLATWALGLLFCALLIVRGVHVSDGSVKVVHAQTNAWTTDSARKLGVRLLETRDASGSAAYPVAPGDLLFYTSVGTSYGGKNLKTSVVVINAKTKKPIAISDLEPARSERWVSHGIGVSPDSVQKAAAGVGLVCGVVLIFFGVILITDNFHIPSNYLYRLYLGL